MKDYTIRDTEKNLFILKYEIVNDEILITFASKEQKRIPYNAENINNVIGVMEGQIYDISEYKKKMEKQKYASFFDTILDISFSTINIILSKCTSIKEMNYILFSLLSGMSLYNLYFFLKTNKILNDIEMYELYLENQGLIDTIIKKHPSILDSLDYKTRIKLRKELAKTGFNINTLDMLNLSRLNKIYTASMPYYEVYKEEIKNYEKKYHG